LCLKKQQQQQHEPTRDETMLENTTNKVNDNVKSMKQLIKKEDGDNETILKNIECLKNVAFCNEVFNKHCTSVQDYSEDHVQIKHFNLNAVYSFRCTVCDYHTKVKNFIEQALFDMYVRSATMLFPYLKSMHRTEMEI
jgi:hypothetical protein